IVERVHFGDNPPSTSRTLMIDFAANHVDERLTHVARSDDELLVMLLRRVSGQVVEQVDDVVSYLRGAREHANVRVEPCCGRIVVARSDMAIGAQALRFFANNKGDLRMGLEADES